MHHNIHRDEVMVNACEWIGWNPIWSEIKRARFPKRTGRPCSGNQQRLLISELQL